MKIDYEKKRIAFRQSWMGNFGNCPNKARLNVVHGDDIRQESDAAMAGTAAHAGIEAFLNKEIDVTDMVDYARKVAYDAAVNGVTAKDGTIHKVNYKSFSDADEMIFHAGNCTQGFINDILPWMEKNYLMEGTAEMGFEYDHEVYRDWTIAHEGTVDWVPDSGNCLIDHKTSGRAYNQAQKQKWAQQPSAYALAALNGAFNRDFDLPIDFHYSTMLRFKNEGRRQDHYSSTQRTAHCVLCAAVSYRSRLVPRPGSRQAVADGFRWQLPLFQEVVRGVRHVPWRGYQQRVRPVRIQPQVKLATTARM